MCGERALRFDRAANGVSCPGEREEERVALCVDLLSGRSPELLAQDPAVITIEVGVAVAQSLERRVEPSMSEKRKVTVPPGRVNPTAAT